MRILYIGDQIIGNPKDGGDAVKKRNRDMLSKICDKVDVIEIPKIGYIKHFINVLLLRNYGHTKALWEKIQDSINRKYDYVFIDGSSNGIYVKKLGKLSQRTIVFCHNVEYEYYKTKYHANKNLLNFILKRYVKYNERQAVQNAYKLVTLNSRDDECFLKYYDRKGDYKLPITFGKASFHIGKEKCEGKFILFVGSNFCSNNEGICWFIKNVSPHIKIKTHIVGSCCNAIEEYLDINQYPNIQLLGFVNDLDKEYREAAAVICPIFTGSGMKTKTIEALRYGKNIIGTSEAFMGVECDYSKIGGLCNTADEFIEAINHMKNDTFNDYSMNVFNLNYSEEVIYPRFKKFLESLK